MNICKILLALVISAGLLTSCVRKKQKEVSPSPGVVAAPVVVSAAQVPKKAAQSPQEKTMNLFVKLLEQADSVHREAWWVLSTERRPLGKSPFGKAQRALMSQQNAKLANKSLFRCDRYEIKRDVLSTTGYPQKIELFEKCSAKTAAKRMASLSAQKAGEFDITFYPDGLEEVLGISASILNKAISCHIRTNADEQLLGLNCKDWAQEKNKEQMIRLDVYDYAKEGKDMIKLRGKIYENLTDVRKIEADVPMTGKIVVTETELYAPTPSPTPKPTPKPVASQTPAGGEQPQEGQEQQSDQPVADRPTVQVPGAIDMNNPPPVLPGGVLVLPPPPPPSAEGDPAEHANPDAANQGVPTDEQGNVIENPQPLPEEESSEPEQQQDSQQQQQHQQQPQEPREILHDQGAPSGR